MIVRRLRGRPGAPTARWTRPTGEPAAAAGRRRHGLLAPRHHRSAPGPPPACDYRNHLEAVYCIEGRGHDPGDRPPGSGTRSRPARCTPWTGTTSTCWRRRRHPHADGVRVQPAGHRQRGPRRDGRVSRGRRVDAPLPPTRTRKDRPMMESVIQDPYYSREEGLSETVERRDPVVLGAGDGPLSAGSWTASTGRASWSSPAGCPAGPGGRPVGRGPDGGGAGAGAGARRPDHRARADVVRSVFAVHKRSPALPGPDRRPGAGRRGPPAPGERGLHPPVADQLQARLPRARVLLALGLRDLAHGGRHAADARGERLGSPDREQRVERTADADPGLAPQPTSAARGRPPRTTTACRSRSRSTGSPPDRS